MEWDWKDFAWDPPGLEKKREEEEEEEEDASVGLRLGEISPDPKESRSCVSSKRSRLHNGSQNISCLVDGCGSDLSGCREYHRRHRVCEKHSKTPVVLVGGKQQRFCQQCSRFHSLGEFDEVKRSCRKRLDGHNRRRRKPQPPSFLMTAEKFMYDYKGPRILQFGNPQAYANPIVRNMWPAASESGAKSGCDHHRFSYRIESCRQDKELLLRQGSAPNSGNANEEAVPAGVSGAISSSASGRGGRKPLPSDSKPGAFDSGCALYLLSKLQTQSSDLSLVQPSITCPMQMQSPAGAAQFGGAVDDEPGGPVLVLDANATNLHCNGVRQMGPNGLVENGDSLTLPFFWE